MHLQPSLQWSGDYEAGPSSTAQPVSLYLILVCLVGSTGGFLFGFDTSVISGVIEYISSPESLTSANRQGMDRELHHHRVHVRLRTGRPVEQPLRAQKNAAAYRAGVSRIDAGLRVVRPSHRIHRIPHSCRCGCRRCVHAGAYLHCRVVSAMASRQTHLIEPVCYLSSDNRRPSIPTTCCATSATATTGDGCLS